MGAPPPPTGAEVVVAGVGAGVGARVGAGVGARVGARVGAAGVGAAGVGAAGVGAGTLLQAPNLWVINSKESLLSADAISTPSTLSE